MDIRVTMKKYLTDPIRSCTMVLAIVLFGLGVFYTSTVRAQTASSTPTLSASKTVAGKQPLVINKTRDWGFGVNFAGAIAGTVKVSPTGVRTTTGGVTPLNTVGSTINSALFTVTGEPNSIYSVTFPSSITLTRTGSTEKMTLTNFVCTATGVLSKGTETFTVGATMTIGPNQRTGDYSGNTYVTVTYN